MAATKNNLFIIVPHTYANRLHFGTESATSAQNGATKAQDNGATNAQSNGMPKGGTMSTKQKQLHTYVVPKGSGQKSYVRMTYVHAV